MHDGVVEIASISAKTGHGDGMAGRLDTALAIILSESRATRAHWLRQIEDEDEFLLVVRWDSVDDHLSFRDTPAFARYRAALAPDLAQVSWFRHYVASGPVDAGQGEH
jgi:quinol monooxygenase YgiN